MCDTKVSYRDDADMKTISAYLALCEGNPPVTGNHQGISLAKGR